MQRQALPMRIFVDDRELAVSGPQSVAAALLSAGIVFRESTSGEPRAPLCGMGICHECRVTIDDVPHQRSCLVPARDGMRIRTGSTR